MFRLIGNISKKVYYEAENASDMNKWRLDNFAEDHHRKGGAVTSYEAPEAMVIVKVKPIKSQKEYLNDLLDEGKFEEYRKITMGHSDRDIEIYGGGKDNPEIINRRKKVEKLFREGISSTKELANKMHISKSVANNDLGILRKTFPELRKRAVKS